MYYEIMLHFITLQSKNQVATRTLQGTKVRVQQWQSVWEPGTIWVYRSFLCLRALMAGYREIGIRVLQIRGGLSTMS